MNQNTKAIIALSNGLRSSKEIAEKIGLTPRYVRKVMQRLVLQSLPSGSQKGSRNHQYKHGRHIDADGYVSVPSDHPHARKIGRMAEHRLVMEQKLGRYLEPLEVVDHIDGLRVHNCPSNLRLFESNAQHLQATLLGKHPDWSSLGRANVMQGRRRLKVDQRVDTYGQRKASGDVRLKQILLASLKLGTDSPYLLGSSYHLEKAGIFDLSRSSLERALDDLYRRYEEVHAQ